MEKKDTFFELDLMQIISLLWSKIIVILISAVVGAVIAFSIANFGITPKYKSQALMYVNNTSFSVGSTSFSISNSELSAAQSLVDTYIVILESRSTLNNVIKESGIDCSYSELKSMIEAAPVNGTEVFSVTVTSTDPKEAEKIANTIAKILPDKISEIVDGSSVRIVDYAVVPLSKDSPNITRFTEIGFVVGLALACLIIIFRKMTDTVIRSEDYLIQTYGVPVLSVVPDLFKTDGSSSYYHKDNYEAASTDTEVK